MISKVFFVNADGTVEDAPTDAAIGRYYFRGTKCSQCGTPQAERKYEVHWASDAHTAKGSGPYRDLRGNENAGTFVLVEVPV